MTGRQVVAITEILKKVFNDGAYKGVADLTPYAESIGKIFELDSTDDGPEVSILRQPVAQVKKKYGVYMNPFGSGEEVQSLSLPEIYLSKEKATEAINKYLKSTPHFSDYNYHVKEIL